MNLFSKLIITCWIFLFMPGIISTNYLSAQTFYGFQHPLGQNTVFFSVTWQGKPFLGAGYNRRIAGISFTDIQAELRFSLDEMFTFSDYQMITGVYKPNKIDNAFIGFGGHLRLEKSSGASQEVTQFSLALTAMPSYTYAKNTGDGVYGTTGLRITYAPVLFASVKGGEGGNTSQGLAAHNLELGGHLDMLIERTIGLSINGFVKQGFQSKNSILPKAKSWDRQGDFYWGSSYWLKRT